MRTCRQRWSLLLFCLSEIFSSVAESSSPIQQVVGTVGESFTFQTWVPVSGTIVYGSDTIGLVFNKQSKTDSMDTFKNRLQWDSQTGFFILSDLRTDDSGLYIVQSTDGDKAKLFYQLNVYKKVSAPQVSNTSTNSSETEVCTLLCSVRNVIGLKLSWYKDRILLTQTNSSSTNITLELPLEIKRTDQHTFICVASNPVSNQSETVKITELCFQEKEKTPGNDNHMIWVIVVLFAVISIIAVTLMTLYLRKKKRQNQHAQDPSATEDREEEVQYSVINHKKHTETNLCEPAPEERNQLITVYDKIRPREGHFTPN